MKTLEAFWRWVDNEKPDTRTVLTRACGSNSKALSPLARTAIDCAADVVWAMHFGAPRVTLFYSLRNGFDRHREDLRNVSLALLPALEAIIAKRDATPGGKG